MRTYDVQTRFQGTFTTPRSSTRFILVHHAAALYRQPTGIEDVQAVANYHTQSRGWPGIGYHTALAEEINGGPIARYNCSALHLQRAHIAYRNHEAIGVACLTNFGSAVPDDKWITALAETIADLRRTYPHAEIAGHREKALGPAQSPDGSDYRTACPGDAWPRWKPELLARVAALGSAVPTPTTSYHAHSPLLAAGPPGLTSAALLTILPDASPGTYTVGDMRLIADAYLFWCDQAQLNPVLLWAQMCHEADYARSWWAQRPRRNPAGIGVTGATAMPKPERGQWQYDARKDRGAGEPRGPLWVEGLRYASWADHGVPSHLGRLLAYCYTDAQLVDDVGLPATIRAVQARRRELVARAMTERPLPEVIRGSTSTWQHLGSRHNPRNTAAIAAGTPPERWPVQGWAHTGDSYGAALASIANKIMRAL